MVNHKPILVLMGPTASGKSAMGITIAKQCGGAILNADAMQTYRDLRIITARPSEEEEKAAPHRLYGIWDARVIGNAALWQQAAIQAIHEAHAAGKVPIVLGGTGMYLKGLTEGLSPVPPISKEVKDNVSSLSSRPATLRRDPDTGVAMQAGMTILYDELKQRDPQMAAKLEPNDSQRIQRALEVMLQTGRSLLEWQQEETPAPFAKEQCHFAMIDIPRDVVYERINQRFEQMMEQGALEEVAALKTQFSPEEITEQRFPILKAHGVPELMAYLDGTMSREDAIAKAQQNTRNYAKRQMTWLRGQVEGAVALPWDGTIQVETDLPFVMKD